MANKLTNKLNKLITFKGDVTIAFKNEKRKITFNGKASDTLIIDDDYTFKLTDGTIIEKYADEDSVNLVLKELEEWVPIGNYNFDPCEVILDQVKEERLWDNIIDFLQKSFPINKQTAFKMAQLMLEQDGAIKKFASWTSKKIVTND